MASSMVDARPTEVTIKFLKGAAMSTTFYYIDSNSISVSLADYTATISVRDADSGLEDPVWTRLLPVVVGDAIVDGAVIPGCFGIILEYTGAETEVLWESAKFICTLIAPDLTSEAFIYGTLSPTSLI
jgi:hypothetical protein